MHCERPPSAQTTFECYLITAPKDQQKRTIAFYGLSILILLSIVKSKAENKILSAVKHSFSPFAVPTRAKSFIRVKKHAAPLESSKSGSYLKTNFSFLKNNVESDCFCPDLELRLLPPVSRVVFRVSRGIPSQTQSWV